MIGYVMSFRSHSSPVVVVVVVVVVAVDVVPSPPRKAP